MKYQPPFGSPDPNAGYVDKSVPGAVAGSKVPAKAIEQSQREIQYVLLQAGLVPSDGDLTQLWQALNIVAMPGFAGRLAWMPVLSVTTIAPPAGPAVGDAYIVPTGATGAWAGHAQKLAIWVGGANWALIPTKDGHGVSLPNGRVFERIGGVYVEKIAGDTQSGKWLYAVDTGAVNQLVVTLDPVPPALVAGMTLRIKTALTNTGAPTLDANGLGPKAILFDDGTAPAGGEFVAPGILELIYTGANWQVLGFSRPTARQVAMSFNRVKFTTPGGTTWTVPAGVTMVRVKAWGAGGGGGYTGVATGAPGAGGAGGYAERTCRVTPGQVINVFIGSGGAGGTSIQFGQAGTDTAVTVDGVVTRATGGAGGQNAPADGIGNGGSGGSPSSVFDFGIVGSRGGDGAGGTVGASTYRYGGWGGAAPNGGSSAAGGYGGVAPGSVPGGGGGSTANVGTVGGAGARGEVWIEY